MVSITASQCVVARRQGREKQPAFDPELIAIVHILRCPRSFFPSGVTLPNDHVAGRFRGFIIAPMPGAKPRLRHLPSIPLRMAACVILLCHLGSATPLVPFAVMTLADLDGSHLVCVEYGAQGVGVRLHHREGDFTPCSCDHHTLAGRAVALLCRSAEGGDHVMTAALASANADLKKATRTDVKSVQSKVGEAIPSVTDHEAARLFSRVVTPFEGARAPALIYHRCALASVRLII